MLAESLAIAAGMVGSAIAGYVLSAIHTLGERHEARKEGYTEGRSDGIEEGIRWGFGLYVHYHTDMETDSDEATEMFVETMRKESEREGSGIEYAE